MILCQDQMLKDLDHRSKITKVIFYTSKDPDHLNDLDLLAKRSPIFPIYGIEVGGHLVWGLYLLRYVRSSVSYILEQFSKKVEKHLHRQPQNWNTYESLRVFYILRLRRVMLIMHHIHSHRFSRADRRLRQFPLIAAAGHDRLRALPRPLQPVSPRQLLRRPRLRRGNSPGIGPLLLRAASQLAAMQDTAARHFRVQGQIPR